MLKRIRGYKTTIAVSALGLMTAGIITYGVFLVESTKLLFSYVKDWDIK